MSKSRHFVNTSLRRTGSKTSESATLSPNPTTFHQEIKKFDDELQHQINNIIVKEEQEQHKLIQSDDLKPRKIKHIKLERDADDIDLCEDAVQSPNIPDNFFPLYNKIKEMRKLITTPVDLIGCVKIPALLRLITVRYRQTGQIPHIEVTEISHYKTEVANIESDPSQKDHIWRFQLLVTLLFSSQTKDEVNYSVMQSLHSHYLQNGYKEGLCIEAVLQTDTKDLDNMIFKVGFHTRKASYLKETAQMLKESYAGDIPTTIDELVQLKGIGYKMGHLILQGAWDETVGISVDTHMVRLCNMFKWLPKVEKNPDNVRKELEKMLAEYPELWQEINPVLVGFGQTVCTPTARRCDVCLLSEIDDKNDVLCPAVDKKLLLRVQRGVERGDKKVRGDMEKLIELKNS